MAALVATLAAATAQAGERTYSRAEVAAILDIIDTHVAERAAREQRKKDAAATRERVRAAKWAVALRMHADHEAAKASRADTKQKAKAARAVRRERLMHLRTGGRSGAGAVRRGR
jgi:hypothetical protein